MVPKKKKYQRVVPTSYKQPPFPPKELSEVAAKFKEADSIGLIRVQLLFESKLFSPGFRQEAAL
jgi:hypothetical protein